MSLSDLVPPVAVDCQKDAGPVMNRQMYPYLAPVLQARWIDEQLRRFTYKKGWKLEAFPGFLGEPFLRISFECEDTYHPGEMTTVAKHVALMDAPTHNADAFATWLAMHIEDCEIHESREWLKRDGKVFNDPHKNGI